MNQNEYQQTIETMVRDFTDQVNDLSNRLRDAERENARLKREIDFLRNKAENKEGFPGNTEVPKDLERKVISLSKREVSKRVHIVPDLRMKRFKDSALNLAKGEKHD